MTEREFAERIHHIGGTAYIVGGWVRDTLMGRSPKDKDYVVCGVNQDTFTAIFPDAKLVGRSFPVYLLNIDDKNSEVAFCRQEHKTGHGYRGFAVEFDESITIEEDLRRRDTTMNAMAQDIMSGQRIDLFGGEKDIRAGVISAISPVFKDDPVRALRCARQAAQLGFSVSDATLQLMRECGDELRQEPVERILAEMKQALEAPRPSIFFNTLRETDLIEITFPELSALIGKTQPVEFHPEGDSWNHVMDIVDKVAASTDNIVARFCGLVHDLGKGVTPPEMLPHHYGHELKGIGVLHQWNQRMTLPRHWIKAGEFVIREHMRAPRLKKDGKIVDLLLSTRSVRPDLPYDDFMKIIQADHNSLPDYLAEGGAILAEMECISGGDAPEWIVGKGIGDWVRNRQLDIYRNWQFT